MKDILISVFAILIFISNTYSQSSSINGRYYLSNSEIEVRITISGSKWFGSTKVKDMHEDGETEYQKGFVKGKNLFDESGYVQIGYVSGNSLTTSIGGYSITLRKR